eukprot:1354856-Amorphochlora_amoeboformis.AAC.1
MPTLQTFTHFNFNLNDITFSSSHSPPRSIVPFRMFPSRPFTLLLYPFSTSPSFHLSLPSPAFLLTAPPSRPISEISVIHLSTQGDLGQGPCARRKRRAS